MVADCIDFMRNEQKDTLFGKGVMHRHERAVSEVRCRTGDSAAAMKMENGEEGYD